MHKTLALLAGSVIAVASQAAESPVARDAFRIDPAPAISRAASPAPVRTEKDAAKAKASVATGVTVTKDPYATPLFLNARPLH